MVFQGRIIRSPARSSDFTTACGESLHNLAIDRPAVARCYSDRPSDVSTEVGMGQKLWHRLIARKRDQSDLEAGPSGVLHGWDAIGVISCQRKHIDRTIG